jgi:hypothetical protein
LAFAVVLTATLTLTLALASLAQADRGVVGHFGEAGSGDGQIGYGYGVAVNGASGDVYVADLLNPRVEHFDMDGNFLGAFGWGVDDGAEEAEICTSGCRSGNSGAGAGQFSSGGSRAVAVDEADGSVYVLDTGNFRIQKFDAEGNFERAFGWGVADGAEELQSCTTSCQSGNSGNGSGQLNENMYNSQLAVDPTSGDVLLSDSPSQRVQEFSASGAFVRSFGRDVEEGGGEGFEVCTEAAKCKPGQPGEGVGEFPGGQPFSVAVDSTDAIYAVDQSPARVQEFTPTGGTLEPSVLPIPIEATIFGFTLDRSTGHVVVLDQDPANSYFFRAEEFDSSGSLVDRYLGGLRTYSITAIAFNPATGRGYAIANEHFVYIIGELTKPEAAISPATDVTATGATLNGSVNSQGEPAAHYHFEYSLEGSGEWTSTSDGTVPGDNSDHAVSAELTPPGGLEPNSTYLARLVAEKPDNDPVTSGEISFSTGGTAPIVETIGSPFRTATTARLDARVNARGAATTYSFEYGPTSAYGSSAPAEGDADAGTSQRGILVSQQVTGLEPGTTYHYRVLATNAFGTTVGDDMTVTTRASDQPLTHGHFPGPPDSDRAYEQVNLPDTGGNPVTAGLAFSDAGDRAIYNVFGGTPVSDHGTFNNQLYAERTADGWETSSIWPLRGEATGASWDSPVTDGSLDRVFAMNFQPDFSEWEMQPGQPARKIADLPAGNYANTYMVSRDVSREIVRMKGTMDPDHPVASPDMAQLYDVTDGSYRLVSFLPDGSLPPCGVPNEGSSINLPLNGGASKNWIAPDGSRMFFPASPSGDCGSAESSTQIFLRDFESEETQEISGPPISGRECSAVLLKSNQQAAYFWTQSRLDPADTAPSAADCATFAVMGSGQGDVYRYGFSDGSLSCLTCTIPNADVGVGGGNEGGDTQVGVADDGSRIYFTSKRRLVEGEGTAGGDNVYRLDVTSGDLKFVTPAGWVGAYRYAGEAMTPDGSVVIFKTADARLNALTGSDNGGQDQYYRYDDRDGSLICVSCPRDGSPPGQVGDMPAQTDIGPNTGTLDENGDFVFITSAPLVGADQNTAQPGEWPVYGNDVYEWRDGRQMLVTTGMTTWPGNFVGSPRVAGITPSGRDVFFTAPEQLTPDAVDGFSRLYDARIGGGFDFPKPPPPCPLEICQGEAPPAPRNPAAGSVAVHSDGNVPATHRKKKHRRCKHGKPKKRCAHHHSKKKTNSHKTGGAR